MKDWGFCSGSYRGYAPGLCAQRTVNLFPLTVSAKGEKTRRALVNVPGKRRFGTLPTRPGRALFFQDGRCFAVAGDRCHEVFANGTTTPRGAVQDSGDPATIVSNGQGGGQLLIVSGGLGFIFTLATNGLAPITDPQFPAGVITAGYSDGFFLAVTPTQFSLSDLEDGTQWGADAGQRVGASDAVRGAIIDHEVLWLFGHLRTEPWFDSGAASFPFEPVPGTFIEGGLGAPYAMARLGDSIAWLLEDERGGRSVVRNQGYNPVPISHEGINAYLTSLPSVADARMWAYQMLDHTFLVLTIPSQQVTLQYDLVENDWSELAFFNTDTGEYEADRASCHAYAFGKHLVLDRQTGDIWELAMDVYVDGDDPRQWLRISPTVNAENHMLFHARAELDAVVGVGLPAGQGVGVTSGSLTFTLPVTPGTYDVRFFLNNTLTRLAISAIVTVPAAATPSLSLGATVLAPGGTIAVTLAHGPGTAGDYIALYPTADPDGAMPISYQYLNGTQVAPVVGLTSATLTFALPVTPGTYDLRFFLNNTLTRLAISAVATIPAAATPSLSLSATVVAAGGTVTVSLVYGPGNPGDYMALFPTAAADSAAPLARQPVNGPNVGIVELAYSDDAGQTFGTPQPARLGAQGQYAERPQWFQLGAARNRNYQLSGNAPVQTVLNDLILDVTQGIH